MTNTDAAILAMRRSCEVGYPGCTCRSTVVVVVRDGKWNNLRAACEWCASWTPRP